MSMIIQFYCANNIFSWKCIITMNVHQRYNEFIFEKCVSLTSVDLISAITL